MVIVTMAPLGRAFVLSMFWEMVQKQNVFTVLWDLVKGYKVLWLALQVFQSSPEVTSLKRDYPSTFFKGSTETSERKVAFWTCRHLSLSVRSKTKMFVRS